MQSILGQKLQEAIETAEARRAMAEWNQSAVTSVTTTTTSTQPMREIYEADNNIK